MEQHKALAGSVWDVRRIGKASSRQAVIVHLPTDRPLDSNTTRTFARALKTAKALAACSDTSRWCWDCKPDASDISLQALTELIGAVRRYESV